jgi:hypothetical protein
LDWDEMEAVPVWKTKNDEVEMFRPDEITLLLALAPATLIPFLTIGASRGCGARRLNGWIGRRFTSKADTSRCRANDPRCAAGRAPGLD